VGVGHRDRLRKFLSEHRPLVEAGLVAAVPAVVYLIVAPSTGDHATQEFRTQFFEDHGFAIWSNLWYGGHHLPGYSLIFPPLAALLGPRVVGALAAVAAAVIFASIADRRWGTDARLGILWFAVSATISIFTGRLTFALGVAVGLGALWAAQRGRNAWAVLLAALCSVSSPVAGLFLAGVGIAWAAARRAPWGLAIAAAAFGVDLMMSLAFPEGGSQPFTFGSFLPAFLITLVALALLPRDDRLLQFGVGIYAVGLLVSVIVDNPVGNAPVNFDNPMGSNAARLGALFAGPLLACVLWRRAGWPTRRWVLALAVLVPLIGWWQWAPVVRELIEAKTDPSDRPGYYAPVRDFVREASHGRPLRVEVVPVVDHWEAAFLPPKVQLARGWERQLDVKLNPLFYEDQLTAGDYRAWLDNLAISYVALNDGPKDFAAKTEEDLLRDRTPEYLRLVYSDRDWEIFKVLDPTPISEGAGHVEKIDTEGFTVDNRFAGTTLVRVHWTPYWTVAGGSGCVSEAPNGFTTVLTREPGRVRVATDYRPWKALGDGPNCREGPDQDDAAGDG
jgi:hypothetical protein